MNKNILSVLDFKNEIEEIIDFGLKLKKDFNSGKKLNYLNNKTLGLIFERASLRTRVSFELGMDILGGRVVSVDKDQIKIGSRESVKDVALVFSRYVDIIVYRSLSQDDLQEFAKNSTVPVINGLDRNEHPCQILADFMTIKEKKGRLSGLNFVFIGDGNNNLTNSYLLACPIVGMNIKVVSPRKYLPKKNFVETAIEFSKVSKSKVVLQDNMDQLQDSDIITTDTWISLWDKNEREQRIKDFKQYKITKEIMANAKKDAIFMHCMPICYQEEVTKEVAYGPQSVVLDEAENRLWAQMALMIKMLS